MKRFFLRTITYLGLYAEIFSASCRWFSADYWGERKPWKSFVTMSLVRAGYLPPSREEIEAQAAQRRIEREHEVLTWICSLPETIQTCLKFDPALLEKLYRGKNHPQGTFYQEIGAHVPAIPPSCKDPELWIDVNK